MSRSSFALGLISLALVLLVLHFGGCSDDSPTSPPPPAHGTLLLSRLSVAVVPGGSETITVSSTDPGGSPDDCSITCSDPDVATAAISDSTITITGATYGIADVTVVSSCCGSRIVPVQVYNPFVLETEELLISYTDQFERINQLYNRGVSWWSPIPPEGFSYLGDFCQTGNSDPSGQHAVMAVKAKPGSDGVAYTNGYARYDTTLMTLGHEMWRPLPPPGYSASGFVIANSPHPTACIRDDLMTMGKAGSLIYHIYEAPHHSSWWTIVQPQADPHSGAFLPTGTWVHCYSPADLPPAVDPVMNVLNVDLPLLAEAPYQSFAPRLSSYDTPPTETVPVMARAMLIPCTIVKDLAHSGDIAWQVANSPFYRLERHVYYKLLYHNYNQTEVLQTNSVTIRSGITTTESERIWNETSISMSVEAGLSFKAFSGSITATVSREFGYETQTSVAELQEKEVATSINTPAGKAVAMWQKFNRFVLYRHSGTDLEPVTTWELGIDSYVTDQYPDN